MAEILAEPILGEIRKGRDIGKHPTNYYIWHACIDCGNKRWVFFAKGLPTSTRCHRCANRIRPYKGRKVNTQGYIEVFLPATDFFSPMIRQSKHGPYIREHRLIMAKALGRCLQPWELVHHKNGNRQDNRLGNLELTTNGSHTLEHSKGYRDGYSRGFSDSQNAKIRGLEDRIRELEQELHKARQ